MSKQIIQFFLVVILIIQSNAKGAISDICLRSAEHISRAPIDAHKDEVIDPKLFKDYEKVNVDAIAYYSDYFESNNPSATQAYFYLLKGLRAVRFITSNGKVSTIHSFEETLSIIKDTRQYPNEESFSSITLGRTSSILLVKKNILLNLACKSVSMRSTGCSDALEFLIKSVDNFGTSLGDTLYRKIIEKYFTQNEHNLILRTAALRMLELLENYLITNELPKKDVYQEIKESLMSELKFTNKSASSWALSILVLFSTRGAEWMSDGIHRMGGARNSSLASIFLITSAHPIF
jgi:hypothetical protein